MNSDGSLEEQQVKQQFFQTCLLDKFMTAIASETLR